MSFELLVNTTYSLLVYYDTGMVDLLLYLTPMVAPVTISREVKTHYFSSPYFLILYWSLRTGLDHSIPLTYKANQGKDCGRSTATYTIVFSRDIETNRHDTHVTLFVLSTYQPSTFSLFPLCLTNLWGFTRVPGLIDCCIPVPWLNFSETSLRFHWTYFRNVPAIVRRSTLVSNMTHTSTLSIPSDIFLFQSETTPIPICWLMLLAGVVIVRIFART